MYKTTINGEPCYVISEKEKEQILTVLEKAEKVGEDLDC